MATEMELPADPNSPAYGVTQIDGKPATSVRFERVDVEGASPRYNVTFKLDSKTVEKLKELDEDSLRAAVGDKNAKDIVGEGKASGTLRGQTLINAYGLSPAEAERRAALVQAQKASEAVQADAMARDEPDEKNKVERVPEKELARIDPADALARAELLRSRERAQADRDAARENQGPQARSTTEQPATSQPTGQHAARPGEPAPSAPELAEKQRQRQTELLDQVHSQFRVSGVSYLFKDQPNKVAFKDKGERMVSSSNDDRVAKAMATMAEGKGWSTIRVTGHEDFKREVWLEASSRGLDVRGYTPNEQDLKLLDSRRERAMHNTVAHAPDIERKRQQAQAPAREAQNAPQSRALGRDSSVPRPDPAPQQQSAPGVPLRSLEGVVVEHGEAPYKNQPGADKSYFVTVAGPVGSQTVWGKDLKRAMEQSKARREDWVKIDYKGNEPVTVAAPVHDARGNLIGREEIAAHRNTWEVQAVTKGQPVAAVAEKLIDSKVSDPKQRDQLMQAVETRLKERRQEGRVPKVQMYDKEAPTRSPERERTTPQVDRRPERTR